MISELLCSKFMAFDHIKSCVSIAQLSIKLRRAAISGCSLNGLRLNERHLSLAWNHQMNWRGQRIAVFTQFRGMRAIDVSHQIETCLAREIWSKSFYHTLSICTRYVLACLAIISVHDSSYTFCVVVVMICSAYAVNVHQP